MLLSHSCQIAIKSIAYAAANGKRIVNVKEFSDQTGESSHSIAKTLQHLVKVGLLSSVTGPNGGFFLNAKQLKQPISLIVKSIDGNSVFENCMLGLRECSAKHPCPVHQKYSLIRKEVKEILEKTTAAELAALMKKGTAFLK